MEIRLACGEMAALCNSADEMRRRLGKVRAERLKQRLSAYREVNRCRTGQLAAQLDDSWLTRRGAEN